jgi:hypothetical protein
MAEGWQHGRVRCPRYSAAARERAAAPPKKMALRTFGGSRGFSNSRVFGNSPTPHPVPRKHPRRLPLPILPCNHNYLPNGRTLRACQQKETSDRLPPLMRRKTSNSSPPATRQKTGRQEKKGSREERRTIPRSSALGPGRFTHNTKRAPLSVKP